MVRGSIDCLAYIFRHRGKSQRAAPRLGVGCSMETCEVLVTVRRILWRQD